MSRADTIAAIATPPGSGGIGVVRVSGPAIDALVEGVAGRIPPPRVATVARFRDDDGAAIDEGIVLYFPAPHSYTGESVVEFHGHGGPAVMRLLLARCVALGARIAEPGEFTKRAFLAGKLDLAQAEGVADLIEAATSTAVRAAARSLTGAFSREIDALVAAVTDLRMVTEASLDFPEEDIDFVRAADAAVRVASVREQVASIARRAQSGARLREGLTVVLAGRPNVGKSSLLNRLAREDAAIVTDVPGTTRDTVERPLAIGGVPVTVIDTAGLRATDDAVEQLGIARTWEAIARADVVVLLVDARTTGTPDAEDAALLARLPPALPRLVVHNKSDLAAVPAKVEAPDGARHVWLSALTGEGVALLEDELRGIVGVDAAAEDTFLARERHLTALREAGEHLARASALLDTAAPALELFAEELRLAQARLSSITGAFTADDLLGVIFTRFCIGK
jgi:tRNA modification GTPase